MSCEVGRILSEAIRNGSLTQTAVASSVEVMSETQLSRALRGLKTFTLDELDAVCSVLGLDLVAVVAAADARSHKRPARPPLRIVSQAEAETKLDEIRRRKGRPKE